MVIKSLDISLNNDVCLSYITCSMFIVRRCYIWTNTRAFSNFFDHLLQWCFSNSNVVKEIPLIASVVDMKLVCSSSRRLYFFTSKPFNQNWLPNIIWYYATPSFSKYSFNFFCITAILYDQTFILSKILYVLR